MNTPPAFAAIRQQQEAEKDLERQRQERIKARRRVRENEFNRKIYEALKPYDNSELDGHPVTIDRDTDGKFLVLVHGKVFLHFWSEAVYVTNCGCQYDDFCVHEAHFSYFKLQVTQTRKDGSFYYCYFPCDTKDIDKPEEFAKAMVKMMDEYRWIR